MSRILTQKIVILFLAFHHIIALKIVLATPVEASGQVDTLELAKLLSQASLLVDPEIFSLEEQSNERSSYYANGDIKVNVRRQAVMNKTRTWPGGIVPYTLNKVFSTEIRVKLEKAMREIEINVGNSSHPCVRFIPRTTEINFVDIRNGSGCSSVVGLDYTGPQVSTFSDDCFDKGVAMHELLHSLGLYHEQDRFDSVGFVNLNMSNMMSSAYNNYVVRNRTDIDVLGTPYDFSSIMHYGPYYFGKNLRWPVLTPKPAFVSGLWMGQRYALSKFDVLRVQRLYHCPEDVSHLVSDISDDKRLGWCDFENGVCNFSVVVNSATSNIADDDDRNTTTGDLTDNAEYWITTSHSTPDGPAGGTTNGLDPFFYASTKFISTSEHTGAKFLSENAAEPSAPENTTISLKTPIISTDANAICIDLRLYQTGPSSHLDMYIMGPLFARLNLNSFKNIFRDRWITIKYTIPLPVGVEFQIEFLAVLESGSVSLDDIHILKHACQ